MLARRQERLPNQARKMSWGRVASVFALVAGLSGVNVAAAQSGSTGGAIGATDRALLIVADGSVEAQFGASVGESLRAIQTVGQPAFYDDDTDDEAEEEEEGGQEDGLFPDGQAEQRAQALGDKAEGRDEDHENSGD